MRLLILIFLLGVFFRSAFPVSAVTYLFSSGRLGDNLISYCHAKWISYKYDIPLFYKPFEYSDQLALHTIEKRYDHQNIKSFKTMEIRSKYFLIDRDANILYVVPYFPESKFESNDPHFPVYFSIDWSDKQFISLLKNLITPQKDLPNISVPPDCISVAVHVRKGTGVDRDLGFYCPHKSPPDEYYMDQICRVAEIFKDKLLYIHIFTDHNKPVELMKYYEQRVNKSNVKFGCQENGISYKQTVLHDFFAMTKFDCLIRSDSHFCLMASKLGNYKVQISPAHITKSGRNVKVDEVNIEVNI